MAGMLRQLACGIRPRGHGTSSKPNKIQSQLITCNPCPNHTATYHVPVGWLMPVSFHPSIPP